MQWRLLIDLDVVDFMASLPSSKRKALFSHFRRIQNFPEKLSDYMDRDANGLRVEVSVFEEMAIHYWIDGADKQVKILNLTRVD